MREMPDTLEGAVKLARKQQSVEKAQKHLRRVKQHGAEAAAMQLPSELEPGNLNAVSQVTTTDNSQLLSLSQQVQHLRDCGSITAVYAKRQRRNNEFKEVSCLLAVWQGRSSEEGTVNKEKWQIDLQDGDGGGD